MCGVTTVGNVNVNVDYYLRIVVRASMLRASQQGKRAPHANPQGTLVVKSSSFHCNEFPCQKANNLKDSEVALMSILPVEVARKLRALYNAFFQLLTWTRQGKSVNTVGKRALELENWLSLKVMRFKGAKI